jgi:hypothetical protein
MAFCTSMTRSAARASVVAEVPGSAAGLIPNHTARPIGLGCALCGPSEPAALRHQNRDRPHDSRHPPIPTNEVRKPVLPKKRHGKARTDRNALPILGGARSSFGLSRLL